MIPLVWVAAPSIMMDGSSREPDAVMVATMRRQLWRVDRALGDTTPDEAGAHLHDSEHLAEMESNLRSCILFYQVEETLHWLGLALRIRAAGRSPDSVTLKPATRFRWPTRLLGAILGDVSHPTSVVALLLQ
jgi:hypothetical protein